MIALRSRTLVIAGGERMFDLDGRVIVVTGALGQLGRQFCSALVKHGARVAGLDLAQPSEAAALLMDKDRALAAVPDSAYLYVQASVCERPSLVAARAAIEGHFGAAVFGLVNNAALDAPPDSDARET